MSIHSRKFTWLRRVSLVLVWGVILVAISGCRSFSFYRQAFQGQCELLTHGHSIAKLVNDPHTPARLKERFKLLAALRTFAQADLKLPLDGHYLKYVDVHRPFVVWNVEAAPEFSMQAKSWWYPIVGRLEYRGYFSREGAEKYARWLQRKGYDVYTGGATAYSTLGWFKDPVLNTFIYEPEPEFAETIFHELGHQRLFAHGDTDFNEAFATTVGQEGARRWLRKNGDFAAIKLYEADLRRTSDFVHLVMRTRARLEAIYGEEAGDEGKTKARPKTHPADNEALRKEKQRIIESMHLEYSELKERWNGNTENDGWFARQINNAQLNSVAAYYDFVPGFERLLQMNGGDLEKFYEAAKRLANLPKEARHERLRSLGRRASEGPQPPRAAFREKVEHQSN